MTGANKSLPFLLLAPSWAERAGASRRSWRPARAEAVSPDGALLLVYTWTWAGPPPERDHAVDRAFGPDLTAHSRVERAYDAAGRLLLARAG